MDNKHDILNLLRGVAAGETTPEQALLQLKQSPFEDLGYAKVDFHRSIRQGAAEVIYGAGKTPEQIAGIAAAMGARGCRNVLNHPAGRTGGRDGRGVRAAGLSSAAPVGHRLPGERPARGKIVVATGGTSDMPVAEEAALTAEVMGNRVVRLVRRGRGWAAPAAVQAGRADGRAVRRGGGRYGRGAGLGHRRAGGLPGGGRPDERGYGANFGGLSALLAMLNSCASGCSVVNIDNGFGAGYLASRINQMEGLEETSK